MQVSSGLLLIFTGYLSLFIQIIVKKFTTKDNICFSLVHNFADSVESQCPHLLNTHQQTRVTASFRSKNVRT